MTTEAEFVKLWESRGVRFTTPGVRAVCETTALFQRFKAEADTGRFTAVVKPYKGSSMGIEYGAGEVARMRLASGEG